MLLELILVVLIALAAVIGLALVAALWHLIFTPSRRTPEPSVDRLSDLSVSRYGPMLRLLDESDFRFLREQPGFKPAMAARLRVQRYQIFLAYLRNLRDDFAVLAAALKLVMSHAGQDRPELASTLFRAQLAFARGIATAYVRAFAWRLGFGRVNAADLLKVFEGVRFELRCLAPDAMAL